MKLFKFINVLIPHTISKKLSEEELKEQFKKFISGVKK